MEKILPIRRDFVEYAEDLEVYKKAFKLSAIIHKRTLNFPKIEQFELARQMRGASKSVCSNLEEGFGKQSYSSAEFRRFLSMSIGSAHEMLTWVKYSILLGYISDDEHKRWKEEYKSIIKMLGKLRSKNANT